MCDKIAVMKDGEIVEFNTTSEILTYPKHNYTKQLIAAASAFKKLNT
jgi:peptide/nickel transport system ATP-binding protein